MQLILYKQYKNDNKYHYKRNKFQETIRQQKKPVIRTNGQTSYLKPYGLIICIDVNKNLEIVCKQSFRGFSRPPTTVVAHNSSKGKPTHSPTLKITEGKNKCSHPQCFRTFTVKSTTSHHRTISLLNQREETLKIAGAAA